MEDLSADGLQRFLVLFEQILVAARQHGDFAARRKMHAAGDRALQGANALGFGQGGEALHFVAAIGGVFNPCATGFQAVQNLLQHYFGDGGRGQASEDVVHTLSQFRG